MSSRFGRADAKTDLFSTYNRSTSPSKSKPPSSSSKPRASPSYSYGYPSNGPPSTDQLTPASPAFTAYPGNSSSTSGLAAGAGPGFRAATPNSRGQYSNAVLDELESQNDEQVGVLTGKVKMLKDLTHLIGDEIRDSTSLADSMNDSFETSRLKLKGTMNRMLRMAEKTGVGWRVWLGFFAAVGFLFWYVWLF